MLWGRTAMSAISRVGVLILWREQRARRLAPRTGETETETEAVTGTKTRD